MTNPIPRNSQGRVPTVITLVAGLILGWALTAPRSTLLRAGGGDRLDESVLTTGPAYTQYNEGSKIQVAHDTIYFLDYRAGKLTGMVPSLKQTPSGTKIFDSYGERDLVADFKIDLDTGAKPHFLMTTGQISSGSRQVFGDGWAALYILETTTRQIAAYKVEQKTIGTSNQVRLELLEIKPFSAKLSAAR